MMQRIALLCLNVQVAICVADNGKQAGTSASISMKSNHAFLRQHCDVCRYWSNILAGAAQLDKLAESSHDSTTTTAADSLSHTEHQPLLVQLQQQTVQAAVVGGVPIEQVSASLLAPTPILAKPLKGPKAVKEAFARLHELSTAAAGPAKELEVKVLPVGTHHHSVVCCPSSNQQQSALAAMSLSALGAASLASQLFVRTGV